MVVVPSSIVSSIVCIGNRVTDERSLGGFFYPRVSAEGVVGHSAYVGHIDGAIERPSVDRVIYRKRDMIDVRIPRAPGVEPRPPFIGIAAVPCSPRFKPLFAKRKVA